MITRHKAVLSTIILTIAGFSAPQVPAAELLTNGDFQNGNTGFTSDYTNSQSIWNADTYAIVNNPIDAHPVASSYDDHTDGNSSGMMMALNGSTDPTHAAWSETVSVVPGDSYNFSMWESEWSNVGNNADLQVAINGAVIGATSVIPNVATWDNSSFTWMANSPTAHIQIFDLNTQSDGNDMALDDLSFSGPASSSPGLVTVPAPNSSSAGIIGFAAVALASYMRKRRLAK